jgi:hypothetical protein
MNWMTLLQMVVGPGLPASRTRTSPAISSRCPSMDLLLQLTVAFLTTFLPFQAAQKAIAQSSSGTKRSIEVVATESTPRLWALLVGVDDYVMLQDLRFAGRDVQMLRKRLVSSGFSEDRVFLLSSRETNASHQPFRSNVVDQLDYLLGRLSTSGDDLVKPGVVRPGDNVVIVLSGHGLMIQEASYFCPADARPDDQSTLIPLGEIYQRLQLCNAGTRLMIVDACRNEPTLSGAKSADHELQREALAKSLETRPEGILMMTSCRPRQVSWEDGGFQHGVFTKFLIDGLGGAADARGADQSGNGNGRVSLTELFQYSSEQTAAYVRRKYQSDQQPSLKVDDLSLDFEFGPYTESSAYETTILVQQEGPDAKPLEGAEVNLFHRPSKAGEDVHLVRAKSNDRGEARATVQLTREQEQTGEIIAIVTLDRRTKMIPLASFFDIRRYTIRMPAVSPLVEQAKLLLDAGEHAGVTELVWNNWDEADDAARAYFYSAASKCPEWWLDLAIKTCEPSTDAQRAAAFGEIARSAYPLNRDDYATSVKECLAASKRVENLETQVQLQLRLVDIQSKLGDRAGALVTLKTAATTADLLIDDRQVSRSSLGIPFNVVPFTGQPDMRREDYYRALVAARYTNPGDQVSADELMKAVLSNRGATSDYYNAAACRFCLFLAENAAANERALGQLRTGQLSYPALFDRILLGGGGSLGDIVRHPSSQVPNSAAQKDAFRTYSSLIAFHAASQKSSTLFDIAAPVALEVKRSVRQESLESQQFRCYLAMACAISGDLERAEGLVRELEIAAEAVLANARSRGDASVVEPLQNLILHSAKAEFAASLSGAGRFEESRSVLDTVNTSIDGIAHHRSVAANMSTADVKELPAFYNWLQRLENPGAKGAAFAGLAVSRTRPRPLETK